MARTPARIACFAGVYANDRALAATLEDARLRDATALWCLGDLGGFGPHPDRAIERVRASGAVVIQGNYDGAIGNGHADCGCGYTDPSDQRFAQRSYDYTLARTSPAHRAWLRALPERRRFSVAGRRVLLCHGSPRRLNEFLWESLCPDGFLEWLCAAHQADVILCAHTGIPWHRALPSGRHVVNVGAIGRPAHDGRRVVWYAELEIGERLEAHFRTVSYDVEATAREMEEEGLPVEFVTTLRTGWWTTCLGNLPFKERSRARALSASAPPA